MMTNPIVAYSDRLGFALCVSCAESENRVDYPYDCGNCAVLDLGDCVACGQHLADLYDPRRRIPKETTR
jgi:hypothetical protein